MDTLSKNSDRRRDGLVLGLFSLAYAVCTLLRACAKPFWYDELGAVYVARLSLGDVFQILSQGIDQHPLLLLAMHFLNDPLGEGPIASRLPALFGFWLMCICLYFFVRRRASRSIAIISLLFPLVTVAYAYAFEARGYGMLLGFTGVAFLSWQMAVDNVGRPLALFLIGASLACASWSHYFGVFIVLPLVAGELARTLRTGRMDWLVLLAMGVGAFAWALLIPWMLRAKALFGASYWAKVSLRAVLDTYTAMLMGAVVPLSAIIVAVFLFETYRSIKKSPEGEAEDRTGLLPPHEVVALISLLLLPFVLGITMKLTGGGYTQRYALPAVFAMAVLPAILLRRVCSCSGHRAFVTAVFSAVVLVRLLLGAAVPSSRPVDEIQRALTQHPRSPLALTDPHAFLQASYYLPESLARRVHFVTDRQALLLATGTDNSDYYLQLLARWVPINVVPYGTFITGHENFLLSGGDSWLLSKLASDGFSIKLASPADASLLMAQRNERLTPQ